MPCGTFPMFRRHVSSNRRNLYHIDVHEQEIVGNIKEFVLYGLGRQEAAINSPEVECGLQQKKKKINREAFTTDNQQDIQGKEQKQGDRGYRPSQYAMGNILKTEDSIT